MMFKSKNSTLLCIALILTLLLSAKSFTANKKLTQSRFRPAQSGKGDIPDTLDNTVISDPQSSQQSARLSAAGEQIKRQIIACGGTDGGSAGFHLAGTAGQAAAERSSSESFRVSSGFWRDHGGSCCNVAGDANDDGLVNVGDAVFLITYIFRGGAEPVCMKEGDANNDCQVNVGDAVYIINYVFKSGQEPICGCAD
jgi:hypothetical protein